MVKKKVVLLFMYLAPLVHTNPKLDQKLVQNEVMYHLIPNNYLFHCNPLSILESCDLYISLQQIAL